MNYIKFASFNKLNSFVIKMIGFEQTTAFDCEIINWKMDIIYQNSIEIQIVF